jgi:hypothetical protein
MANPFVHVELNTTDVGKAKEFYGWLFDWKLEDLPMGVMGTYTTIGVGGGTSGGIIAASYARAAFLLALLCERRRYRSGYGESEIAGRDHHPGGHAGGGDGMAKHLHRSDGGGAGLVAGEEGVGHRS